MTVDWVATGQVASAIASLVLVYVTWRYVQETRQMVRHMQEQSSAAQRSADASEQTAKASLDSVREMQRMRVLEQQPFLTGTSARQPRDPKSFFPFAWDELAVTNAGRGIAQERGYQVRLRA